MTDQGNTPPEPLDLDAIWARHSAWHDGDPERAEWPDDLAAVIVDAQSESPQRIAVRGAMAHEIVREDVPALLAALDAAYAEAERLRAFAEAVLALHRRNRPEDGVCAGWTTGVPSEYRYLDDWCVECRGRNGREYGTAWPCRTAALAWDAEGRPLVHATPTRQETSDV